MLSADTLKAFAQKAQSLGLEVLCEIHDLKELEKTLIPEVACIGINSRDLDTLQIDTASFERIGAQIPNEFLKVAESGLRDPNDVKKLRALGFSGFLIGEQFMKAADPVEACARFIEGTY
jgi:indole-3-glycerol phosphate synthase